MVIKNLELIYYLSWPDMLHLSFIVSHDEPQLITLNPFLDVRLIYTVAANL